jgi:hypothetical protein
MGRDSNAPRVAASGRRASGSRLGRVCSVRRAAAISAIAVCLIAAAAVFPARASAVADERICGPSGYPYCTWAYAPRRGYSIGIFNMGGPYVFYGGIGNYNGITYKVCINIRLIIGSDVIFKQDTFCYAPAGGTDTSTNVWDSKYVCCSYLYWYHTWAHSWQVFVDGSTHNHRYVATGQVLF